QWRRGARRRRPPRKDEGGHLGPARRRHLRGASYTKLGIETALRARTRRQACPRRASQVPQQAAREARHPTGGAGRAAVARSDSRQNRARCGGGDARADTRGAGVAMIPALAMRMMRETDPRLLWKLSYNFGYKGMRSVQRFKKRLKRGEHFPPFLYI